MSARRRLRTLLALRRSGRWGKRGESEYRAAGESAVMAMLRMALGGLPDRDDCDIEGPRLEPEWVYDMTISTGPTPDVFRWDGGGDFTLGPPIELDMNLETGAVSIKGPRWS